MSPDVTPCRPWARRLGKAQEQMHFDVIFFGKGNTAPTPCAVEDEVTYWYK
jgi:hypothetical protein